MHSIRYLEHDPNSARQFSTEARISSDCFDIRIENAQWSRSGMATIEAEQNCLLRLILSSADRTLSFSNNTGRFLDRGGDFKPLGPALFIPSDTTFQFSHGMTDHKALICLFNPDALSPMMTGMPWNWNGCVSDNMLNLDTPYLMSVLQRLARECMSPGFASELQIECLLTAMALDLQNEYGGQKVYEANSPDKLCTATVKYIRDMFEAGPEVDCSLAALAAACNIPARKLSQQFKNTTGRTLRQYAAQTRIRQAKSLLLNPNVLIKQVAYQTGFQNPASFTAAFRKEVGVTPEMFRSSV